MPTLSAACSRHELLKAQEDLAAGLITQTQFKTIEDRAVDEVIVLQEEAGLEVVTDGEMRRRSFQSQMTQAVEGFGEWGIDAFLWGEWHGDDAVGDWRGAFPAAAAATPEACGSKEIACVDWRIGTSDCYPFQSGREIRSRSGPGRDRRSRPRGVRSPRKAAASRA